MAQTLTDWIEIVEDIDGYIAKGGQLLDLYIPDLSKFPEVRQFVLERLRPETLDRLERFLQRLGEGCIGHGDPSEKVSQHYTEEMARLVWRATAAPSTGSAH